MVMLLHLVDHASQESNEASPSMESTSLRSAENTPRWSRKIIAFGGSTSTTDTIGANGQ